MKCQHLHSTASDVLANRHLAHWATTGDDTVIGNSGHEPVARSVDEQGWKMAASASGGGQDQQQTILVI